MRAGKLAASVGTIQVVLNQGDYWMRGAVTGMVVLKTIMTPVVTFAVSLYAAAETKTAQLKNEKVEMEK